MLNVFSVIGLLLLNYRHTWQVSACCDTCHSALKRPLQETELNNDNIGSNSTISDSPLFYIALTQITCLEKTAMIPIIVILV